MGETRCGYCGHVAGLHGRNHGCISAFADGVAGRSCGCPGFVRPVVAEPTDLFTCPDCLEPVRLVDGKVQPHDHAWPAPPPVSHGANEVGQ